MIDGVDMLDVTQSLDAKQGDGGQTHKFLVTVTGCTVEQAQRVMSERLGFDELRILFFVRLESG